MKSYTEIAEEIYSEETMNTYISSIIEQHFKNAGREGIFFYTKLLFELTKNKQYNIHVTESMRSIEIKSFKSGVVYFNNKNQKFNEIAVIVGPKESYRENSSLFGEVIDTSNVEILLNSPLKKSLQIEKYREGFKENVFSSYRVIVEKGQSVKKGEVIAVIDNFSFTQSSSYYFERYEIAKKHCDRRIEELLQIEEERNKIIEFQEKEQLNKEIDRLRKIEAKERYKNQELIDVWSDKLDPQKEKYNLLVEELLILEHKDFEIKKGDKGQLVFNSKTGTAWQGFLAGLFYEINDAGLIDTKKFNSSPDKASEIMSKTFDSIKLSNDSFYAIKNGNVSYKHYKVPFNKIMKSIQS